MWVSSSVESGSFNHSVHCLLQKKVLEGIQRMNQSRLDLTKELSKQSSVADGAIMGLQDLSAFWKAEAEKQTSLCAGIRSSGSIALESARAALQSTKVIK